MSSNNFMAPASGTGAQSNLFLILGPSVAVLVWLICQWSGLDGPASWTSAITILCAIWWVTEPVPIPITSLVPFVGFPLSGVLDHKAVATAYGHTLVLLLLGGFMLSTAMAHVGAHRRLALAMVRTVGGGGKRLILGFMLATAVCSMWISNTATTLMMLPVALAIVGNNGPQTQGHAGKGEDAGHPLAVPLLLGIAYAASIGGMGTPVGTPPNVIFMGIYREATGVDVGFLDWMLIGLPVVVLMLPVAWLWVTRGVSSDEDVSLPEQGQWSTAERRVMAVFVVTALAWMTRTAPFGGWSSALDVPGVGDSTVALAAVIAMFLIPSGQGERLLNWETASRIPWGLLLLFGGGIAIARAFESSGLSVSLGTWLADDVGIVGWPLLGMLAALCLGVTFLTEVTSNTATTTLLMPVLAATGVAAGVDPILLMVPATLSASCAFMLPVATAPNAIVFGTDKVSIRQMAKMGFGLNLMGAALLVGVCSLIL